MGILGKHPGVGGQRGQREHSFATVSEAPIVMSNGNAPVGDPPRRLLIVGSTPGPYGGLEAFMITVAEAAQAWPGFEVRMCFKLVRGTEAQDSLRAAFAKTGIPTAVVRSGSRELLRQIRWAHVLHVQNVPPDVIAAGRLLGKRVYCTIHNWRRSEFPIHYVLWGISWQFAHRRWYNSEYVMRSWEGSRPRASSEAFPTVSDLPTGIVDPTERRGFVFVGRWIANKGIEELIAAYASAKLDRDAWPLTIVGDGERRGVVERLLSELDVPEVQLPGFVSADEKNDFIRRAKWLVAPANTREDMGLTPIEARSVGVPAIVTRDGGLPEAGGPAALLAEPGDVRSLAAGLEEAAAMPEHEYRRRATLAKSSLTGYLRPMSFYREAFAR